MDRKGYRSSNLMNYLDFTADFSIGDAFGASSIDACASVSVYTTVHRSLRPRHPSVESKVAVTTTCCTCNTTFNNSLTVSYQTLCHMQTHHSIFSDGVIQSVCPLSKSTKCNTRAASTVLQKIISNILSPGNEWCITTNNLPCGIRSLVMTQNPYPPMFLGQQ